MLEKQSMPCVCQCCVPKKKQEEGTLWMDHVETALEMIYLSISAGAGKATELHLPLTLLTFSTVKCPRHHCTKSYWAAS